VRVRIITGTTIITIATGREHFFMAASVAVKAATHKPLPPLCVCARDERMRRETDARSFLRLRPPLQCGVQSA
jgi:hypothetical protein